MLSHFFTAPVTDNMKEILKRPSAFINEVNLLRFTTEVTKYIEKNGTEAPAYPTLRYYIGLPINQSYAGQVGKIIQPLLDTLATRAKHQYPVPYTVGKLLSLVLPLMQPLYKCYQENKTNKSKTIAPAIDFLFENIVGKSAQNITDPLFEERLKFLAKTFQIDIDIKPSSEVVAPAEEKKESVASEVKPGM